MRPQPLLEKIIFFLRGVGNRMGLTLGQRVCVCVFGIIFCAFLGLLCADLCVCYVMLCFGVFSLRVGVEGRKEGRMG